MIKIVGRWFASSSDLLFPFVSESDAQSGNGELRPEEY